MAENYWDHPRLAPYRKRIPRGETIFKQNAVGQSMFLVLEGVVQLGSEVDGRFGVINLLGEGELFGEQAVLAPAPYRRALGARTMTDVTVLEIGTYEIAAIRNTSAELLSDLLNQLFRIAAKRLSRNDAIIRILRKSDTRERLVGMILHFAEVNACEIDGVEYVLLSPESLGFYTDVPRERIGRFLADLRHAGVLTPLQDDYYRAPNGDALRKYLQKTAGQAF